MSVGLGHPAEARITVSPSCRSWRRWLLYWPRGRWGELLVFLPISHWKLSSAIAEPREKPVGTDPGNHSLQASATLPSLKIHSRAGESERALQLPVCRSLLWDFLLLGKPESHRTRGEGQGPGKRVVRDSAKPVLSADRTTLPWRCLQGTNVLAETLIPK